MRKLFIILASVAVLAAIAAGIYASITGPGKKDLAKISMTVSQDPCFQGDASFAINNDSEYTVTHLEFRIWGITADQSKIDLGMNRTEIVTIPPHQSHSGCWHVDFGQVKDGEQLASLQPEIQSVGFAVKGGGTQYVY